MTAQPLETTLHQPVCRFFSEQGYTVRSEVRDCDLTATKDGELTIVEFKRRLNLDVLLQAADRQLAANAVFIAIFRPKTISTRRWRTLLRILGRLQIGLLLVNTSIAPAVVELVLDAKPGTPTSKKRRRRILDEAEQRSADYNQGGSHGRKLMTAYREQAIQIACLLQQLGPQSPKALRALGTSKKTQPILADNHYQWFERVRRGVYQLTDKGLQELQQFPELTAYYIGQIAKKPLQDPTADYCT